MRIKLRFLFFMLALPAGLNEAAAQSAQFFRIAGPAATKITAFQPGGLLVWSNSLAGTNYTVQTATSLAGGNLWVDYVKIHVTSKINTNQIITINPPGGMAFIPAGVFTMGDTLDGDIDAIPATVAVSSFYMDVNLVSSNQWAGVYAFATSHGYTFVHAGSGKSANHPVQTVDWFDCVKWSNARSQQAGLMPVYYTDGGYTQVFTNGDIGTTVYANWAVNGYRLPTEAEWEKAARGGLSGLRFPLGNTISESQANYYAYPNPPYSSGYTYDSGPYLGSNTNFNTGGFYTSPVGYFAPNGYGLYDMAANVNEWCWDWYAGPSYPAGSPYLGGTDPRGPVGPLNDRVVRGGFWGDFANDARCAARQGQINPPYADGGIGFRCVRGL